MEEKRPGSLHRMSEAGTKVDKYRASGRTDRHREDIERRGEERRGEEREIIKVSQYLDTQTAPHFMKVEGSGRRGRGPAVRHSGHSAAHSSNDTSNKKRILNRTVG